jgi:preprotein translocase subunit SecG
MSNKLLLPNKFKIIGWCLLIPATIFGLLLSFTNFEAFPLKAKIFAIFSHEILSKSQFLTFIETNITTTIVGVLFIVGAMIVGFSKEKSEDEFIAKVRLSSLLWAVWVNYILLFVSFLFVYGTDFLTVMMYNMFTVLIIFIVRFNYILYKNSKSVSDEK